VATVTAILLVRPNRPASGNVVILTPFVLAIIAAAEWGRNRHRPPEQREPLLKE
jgi:hypothetical protein